MCTITKLYCTLYLPFQDDSNSDSGSDFEVDQEDRAATSYRDNTLNKSLVTESSK